MTPVGNQCFNKIGPTTRFDGEEIILYFPLATVLNFSYHFFIHFFLWTDYNQTLTPRESQTTPAMALLITQL